MVLDTNEFRSGCTISKSYIMTHNDGKLIIKSVLSAKNHE